MHDSAIKGYLIFLWVALATWLIVCTIVYCVCRTKKSLKIHRMVILVFAIVILLYGGFKTTLCVMDMTTDAYVIEKGSYSRCFHAKGKLFEDPIYFTRLDGSSVSLAGGGSEYPYGEYFGTVTYSKRSRIIMDFHVERK